MNRTGQQYSAHSRFQQGIEARTRITQFLLLRKRDRALCQALENQVIQLTSLGKIDGRLDPIARVACAAT
jgi:DNA-binding TFAR19-related protein (PDSD5 family)